MLVLIFEGQCMCFSTHPRRSSTFTVASVKTKRSTEAAARFCHYRGVTKATKASITPPPALGNCTQLSPRPLQLALIRRLPMAPLLFPSQQPACICQCSTAALLACSCMHCPDAGLLARLVRPLPLL